MGLLSPGARGEPPVADLRHHITAGWAVPVWNGNVHQRDTFSGHRAGDRRAWRCSFGLGLPSRQKHATASVRRARARDLLIELVWSRSDALRRRLWCPVLLCVTIGN